MSALEIYARLCITCQHGECCPGMDYRRLPNDGFSCARYVPEPAPKEAMSAAHILALPDREPCADCAGRKGTEANGTPHTMNGFHACVERREPFFCHGAGQGRICAGWLRAAKARHG